MCANRFKENPVIKEHKKGCDLLSTKDTKKKYIKKFKETCPTEVKS